VETQSGGGTNTTTRSAFNVAPETLALFTSQPTTLQTTYTVTDRERRHLVVEFTVPLRNVLASLRTVTPS
jgi:type IV pilus assembly protein PilW